MVHKGGFLGSNMTKPTRLKETPSLEEIIGTNLFAVLVIGFGFFNSPRLAPSEAIGEEQPW
ncbi:MAG: hypothetical protein A3D92_07635 [Bacteroidetes bacterium RIFCSPHIGHO2_02_FULL_44_7]|nr:MAG: hypothetical protein A3D92_07635 [Bacteroidetes bacterium RIFCSPHIGHO2_02_FULL_44_7]